MYQVTIHTNCICISVFVRFLLCRYRYIPKLSDSPLNLWWGIPFPIATKCNALARHPYLAFWMNCYKRRNYNKRKTPYFQLLYVGCEELEVRKKRSSKGRKEKEEEKECVTNCKAKLETKRNRDSL